MNGQSDSKNALGRMENYMDYPNKEQMWCVKLESKRNESNENSSGAWFGAGYTWGKTHWPNSSWQVLPLLTEEAFCNSTTVRHCMKRKADCHTFFLESWQSSFLLPVKGSEEKNAVSFLKFLFSWLKKAKWESTPMVKPWDKGQARAQAEPRSELLPWFGHVFPPNLT